MVRAKLEGTFVLHKVLLTFLLLICYGCTDFANAHRFKTRNTINGSLSAQCYDPGSGPQNAATNIVSQGSLMAVGIHDSSMSRVCAFNLADTVNSEGTSRDTPY
jgi:hypothetical protein